MENIVINNSAGNAPNNRSDGLPAAHNSDGFDVSSCNDTIIRNNWVSNQDDCKFDMVHDIVEEICSCMINRRGYH